MKSSKIERAIRMDRSLQQQDFKLPIQKVSKGATVSRKPPNSVRPRINTCEPLLYIQILGISN